MSSRARIYDAVRRIPRGRVSTYGDVAVAAGLPGHARQVGYALAALEPDSDVPWHRVVARVGGSALEAATDRSRPSSKRFCVARGCVSSPT